MVRIEECRPNSKLKRWQLVEVLTERDVADVAASEIDRSLVEEVQRSAAHAADDASEPASTTASETPSAVSPPSPVATSEPAPELARLLPHRESAALDARKQDRRHLHRTRPEHVLLHRHALGHERAHVGGGDSGTRRDCLGVSEV
jgi:hypothetical protein